MKKFLLITGIVLVVIFGVLIAAPFLFKDKIQQAVLEEANNNLNATVGFKDISLSFIRNFPNASITLEELFIVGKDEFEGDTLLFVDELNAVVDIKSLFSDTGYDVKKILLRNPSLYAHVLKDGKANWDITKPDSIVTEEEGEAPSAFKLKLQKLIIENGTIKYRDELSNMTFVLNNLNHTLSGDLTAESTILETSSTAGNITLEMDNISYLKDANANLAVDIKADLKNMIFTLSKNKSTINAIDFQLDGWVKILDNGYEMDVKITAPSADFKQILSMIPAIYAKDFEGIQTKGKVKLEGYARGLYTDSVYPSFNIDLVVNDAWFKYPALPKSVDNINITANVSNPGGSLDATKVNVKRFSFVLGGNPFQGNLNLTTPMSDPNVDFFAKGKLNLGMIKEVYPLDSGMELSGILDADLKLNGKMSYYDKEQYEKFLFDGKMSVANMVLKTGSLPHDVEIKQAKLEFNSKFVNLPVLQLKIGKSDLSGSGKLENFIPYVLRNETLKGTLQTNSEYLNVDDLMSSAEGVEAQADTTAMTIVELPSNLNFTLNSSFKKIIFGTIDISNAKGVLELSDSKLTFKNISLQAMGGTILMNGIYSTQDKTSPDVDIDLKINNVLFTEIYNQVETVRELTPIFKNASGRFSTTMEMKTKLGNDMMPVISTLYGKGVLISEEVGLKNVKVFNTLGTVLNREELKNPEIEKVNIPFEIKDGRVYTEPFDMKIGATTIKMDEGSTGIDQTIDYTMKLEMPTPETTIVKISKIGVKLGGTFTKPSVKIQTREMFQDAAATLKGQAKEKINEAGSVAKEQINEMKQNIKEGVTPDIKKAGENIKTEGGKLIKGLFKK